jgi:hydrogenase maturation protein HypF
MELEFAADGIETMDVYPFELPSGERNETLPSVIDWGPMMKALLRDISARSRTGLIAAKFHKALVEIMLAVAHRAGEERVVLTGGCFQNRTLCERAVTRLRAEGFRCYWHQRIPPNDGGIALGQAAMALALLRPEGR